MKTSLAQRKLHSKAGETIAETLVALLISALALVMLAGAISATAKVITTSDKKMGEYYEQDEKLAVMPTSSPGPEGQLNITITGTAFEESKQVNYYMNSAFNAKPVVAYKTANTAAPGD